VKRPLVVFTLMLVLGIVNANEVKSLKLAAIITTVMLAISFIGTYMLNCRRWIIFTAILFFFAGSAVYTAATTAMERKTEGFIGEIICVNGFVDGLPETNEYGIRFPIKAKKITIYANNESYDADFKVQVSISGITSTSIQYGDYIGIRGRMVKPSGSRNPGGFNNRLYLAQKGICAIINVSDSESIEVIKAGSGGSFFVRAGYVLRDKMIRVINNCLPVQHAALLNAMLIGYRDDLGDDMEKAFGDSGLLHIMAVSGANVAFLVFPMLFICKKFGIGKVLSSILTIALLAIFLFVTGFEPSVVRAVIMADTALTARMLRREADVHTSIALAAMLMLLHNPFVLYNIGFQLSYAATISMCLFYGNVKKLISRINFSGSCIILCDSGTKIPDMIKDTLAATISAQLGVLPISALYFNNISVISLLSNLIVVPLTGVITIIGLVMSLAGGIWMAPAMLLGHVNYSLLSIILYTAKLSSRLPFAAVTVPSPSILFFILYYSALLLFLWLIPRLITKKSIQAKDAAVLSVIIILVVTVVISVYGLMFPPKLKIVFMDVGDGDSIYIETPGNKRLLVDGGTGGRVLQCLLYHGVLGLDAVIATHGHKDHTGGLTEVLEKLDVSNLILPGYTHQPGFNELKDIAAKKGINILYLNSGDNILAGDKLQIEIIHPDKNTAFEENNGSLAFMLTYGDAEILFTGDLEIEAENEILEKKLYINADVIKIAHHGSNTSSSDNFLKEVSPAAAIISAGGKWEHPSPDVVEKIRSLGTHVFRTDTGGAIILETDGSSISINRWIKSKADKNPDGLIISRIKNKTD
jgi:competence protein ComEC